MFKTILVAHDGSEHAERALKMAAGLAAAHGAKLHLAHAPQMDTPTIVIGSYVSLLDAPPTKEQIQAASKKITDKAKADAEALGVTLEGIHLGANVPAAFVLQKAKELDADLIVLGRRGLGAFGSLAMGSVSQAISHEAKCAVLTAY